MAHDEGDLAERIPAVTEEDVERIGQRAGDYAFSAEHALPSGSSMGTLRAISLAAVDVLEGAPRELHRKNSHRRGPSAEEASLRRLGLGH